jgi:hypothetical protein
VTDMTTPPPARVPALRALWEAVRRTYKRIGHAEARAIMSGFYFIGLGPVAILIGKRRRRAMLALDGADRDSGWLETPERSREAGAHSAQQY